MGKHTPSRRARRLWLLLLLVLLLAAGTVSSPSLARRVGLTLPWNRAAQHCGSTAVELVVAPEAAPAVQTILAPLQGERLIDGDCLQAVVRPQTPAQLVETAALLPADRAPQLWIPDSSLWIRQVDRWPLREEASFATSPLVIATSGAAVSRLGWAGRAPTWPEALSGIRPVAMPDLQTNAAGLVSILALWQSLGKGPTASQAVAAAVLASTRSTAPTPQAALDAAAKNDPGAPLLATSEITVFNANRGATSPRLVAVYPRNGSPSLDYPILRVAGEQQDAVHTIAVNAVLTALESRDAGPIIRRDGLRDVSGAGPAGVGVRSGSVSTLTVPSAAEITAFLARLQELQVPSRILTVMDVSLSMRSIVPGTGLTRFELAGRAAMAAGDLLSDRSSAGLWAFALQMNGQLPYLELSPVLPLGATIGGVRHRDQMNQQLAALGNHLSGGGTALYVTALDAMRAMQASYDPTAVNSVVLFTDGTNENDPTLTLPQVVAALQKLHDPREPIRLIAIGIGPTADLAALRAMVAPTGGQAYQAETPDQLRQVLFDALSHRVQQG